MQRKATILILLAMTFSLAFGQVYTEDFEDGNVSEWQTFFADEENIQVVDMTSAPAVLVGGDDKVGYLQDIDGSYTGIANVLTGTTSDVNYTVEADVYVYANPAGSSAYSGLVAYADSSLDYYVKLVVDFDGDDRLRLFNNKFSMATFSYSFDNTMPTTNIENTEGWHHMKLGVVTNDDNTVSYTCWYDEINLGTFVDDAAGHTTSGMAGVFSMQQDDDGLPGYFDNYVVTPAASDLDHFEDFEDGDVSEWQTFFADEENIQVVDMTSAPAVLVGGDDKVGYLQDIDGSYTGIANVLTGTTSDVNYTVEADVYVYANPAGSSAYSGLVAYADSSLDYYVKLVVDFDGDDRLRLFNNKFSMATFSYSFDNTMPTTNIENTEGWHHMKLGVVTNDDNTVSYTCWYDEINLGTFVDDAAGHTTSGMAGVFSMQQDDDGLPGYFDNYGVTAGGTTSIFNTFENVPVTMTISQNFPNPFNPSTTISIEMHEGGEASLEIFNIRGEIVTTLAQGNIQPGSYRVTWDGRDNKGQVVAAGNYIAVLSKGNEQVSRNMLMLK
mgnify:CR=1 FL=1